MATVKNIFWNAEQSRLRAFWRLLGQMFLAQGLTAVILTTFDRIIPIPPISGTAPLWMFPLVGGTMLTTALLSVWLAGRYLDKRPFADFGFHIDRSWWLDLGFGLALGVIMTTFVFLVQLAAGWATVSGTLQMSLPDRSFSFTFFIFLLLFIFVGVGEEVVSRGYQITNAAEGLNTATLGFRKAMILAWLFSSGIFGILHITNPNASFISTVAVVIGGLFLGLGFVLTGELAISIGVHITWNLFLGNVYGFAVSGRMASAEAATIFATVQNGPAAWTGGAFGPEAGLVGMLALVLGSALVLGWVKWRYGRLFPPANNTHP